MRRENRLSMQSLVVPEVLVSFIVHSSLPQRCEGLLLSLKGIVLLRHRHLHRSSSTTLTVQNLQLDNNLPDQQYYPILMQSSDPNIPFLQFDLLQKGASGGADLDEIEAVELNFGQLIAHVDDGVIGCWLGILEDLKERLIRLDAWLACYDVDGIHYNSRQVSRLKLPAVAPREPPALQPLRCGLANIPHLIEELEPRRPLFINSLEISAMQTLVTFTPTLTDNPQRTKMLTKFGLSFTTLEKAPFSIPALPPSSILLPSTHHLYPFLVSHVTLPFSSSRTMGTIGSILMSSNTLGNLNMLSRDFKQGFSDFVAKPVEGFRGGGVLGGGLGVAKGTASLVGNAGKGVVGSLGRVVGSVGRGLLVLADDKQQ